MYRAADVYRGNCAKSTFYKWVAEGLIQLYRVGGNVYVDGDFPTLVKRIAAQSVATESPRGKAARAAALRRHRATKQTA